ncbi:MAG: nucleotidyltransferase domain-containing protein [Candidatus Caldatribacterium sp.]|nr:nucleotidyltransferase domain-containing protein [Candidatus Caldatribacterium sp.]
MRREDVLAFLQAHKEELMREFQLRRIGLFGSFARGENNEQSDIDIVVEMEEPDLFKISRLEEKLTNALGRKVDVLRLRKNMDALLRKRVENESLYV